METLLKEDTQNAGAAGRGGGAGAGRGPGAAEPAAARPLHVRARRGAPRSAREGPAARGRAGRAAGLYDTL